MTHNGHSVVFAALLLVAQLLFGVISGGAMAHAGVQHCDGCPSGDSPGMSHGMDTHGSMSGGDDGGSHCATHCSHDGTTGTGNAGCGSGCVMPGSGTCGTHASPALNATASIRPAIVTGSFGGDRRSIALPDSPLFDFLRPPTRA